MSRAVCTDIQYVEPGGCCRSRMVFRSVWDRLCQQLFGAIPPGMDTEDILPDITIWQEGIVLQEEEGGVFSFTVTTSGEEAPKAQDVILYKGIFYIVGEVDGQGDDTQQDDGTQQVGGGGNEQTSTDSGAQVTDPTSENQVPGGDGTN